MELSLVIRLFLYIYFVESVAVAMDVIDYYLTTMYTARFFHLNPRKLVTAD